MSSRLLLDCRWALAGVLSLCWLLTSPVAAEVYRIPFHDRSLVILLETPAGEGPFPLVVDLHGSGWHIDKNQANVAEWTRYGCLGMDVEFTQDVDSLSVEEVGAAIDWVRAHWPVKAVAIHGFSLGARIAYQIAVHRHDLAGVSGMSGRVRLWDGTQPVLDAIGSVSCPVLIQQGQDDRVVPVTEAETLAAALRARSKSFECCLYKAQGHRLDLLPWTRPMARRFLQRCFAAAPTN